MGVFAARQDGLRKNSFNGTVSPRSIQQGLKPTLISGVLLARLKPCPCYKASFACTQASFSATCKVMPCYKALPRMHQLRIWSSRKNKDAARVEHPNSDQHHVSLITRASSEGRASGICKTRPLGLHSHRSGCDDPRSSALWSVPEGRGVSRLIEATSTWLPGAPSTWI